MKKQKKALLKNLSLISGVLLLCFILIFTVSALKTTGQCYMSLKGADLSQKIESSLYYDDHLYASIGYGISIFPSETGKEARLSSFLSSSVQAIDMRIIICGLLYSMMVSVVIQYYLYSKYHSERKKHVFSIVLSSAVPFAVFSVTVLFSQSIFGLPYVILTGHEWFLIAVCLLSVSAGNCVLGAVLSAVRHKKLTALLAVPVVFCLFIVGMNLECHLFASPTIESFDYFYETHSDVSDDDFDGDFYYDEKKNVIIFDGMEYPPETVNNTEYYTGLKRAGAFIFELIDAYSGNGLLMTETIVDDPSIPFWTAMVYIIKAVIWILLSLYFIKHRCIQASMK